jgi:hypothetical protein
MSHLHRLRAAQLAIAADAETTHPCTPTVTPAEAVELATSSSAKLAPAAAGSTARGKRAARKKATRSKR